MFVQSTTNICGSHNCSIDQFQRRAAVTSKLEYKDDESNVGQCMSIYGGPGCDNLRK